MTEDYFIRNKWDRVDIRDGFDGADETFYYYTLSIGGATEVFYSSDDLDSAKLGRWYVTIDCSGFDAVRVTDENKITALINAIKGILE